jgi:hypothetical protein
MIYNFWGFLIFRSCNLNTHAAGYLDTNIVESWQSQDMEDIYQCFGNPPHIWDTYQKGDSDEAIQWRKDTARIYYDKWEEVRTLFDDDGEKYAGVSYRRYLINLYTCYYLIADILVPENLLSANDDNVKAYKNMVKDLKILQMFTNKYRMLEDMEDIEAYVQQLVNEDIPGYLNGWNIVNAIPNQKVKNRLSGWLTDIVNNHSDASFQRYTMYIITILRNFMIGALPYNFTDSTLAVADRAQNNHYSNKTKYKNIPNIDECISDKKNTFIFYNEFMRMIGVLDAKVDGFIFTENRTLFDKTLDIEQAITVTLNHNLYKPGNYIIQPESLDGKPDRWLILSREETDENKLQVLCRHVEQEILNSPIGYPTLRNIATVGTNNIWLTSAIIAECVFPDDETPPDPPHPDVYGSYRNMRMLINDIEKPGGPATKRYEHQYTLLNPFTDDIKEQLVFRKNVGRTINYIFNKKDIVQYSSKEDISDMLSTDRRHNSAVNQAFWLEIHTEKGERYPKTSKDDDTVRYSKVQKKGSTSFYNRGATSVESKYFNTRFKPLGVNKWAPVDNFVLYPIDVNYNQNVYSISRYTYQLDTSTEDLARKADTTDEDWAYQVQSQWVNEIGSAEDELLNNMEDNQKDKIDLEVSLTNYYNRFNKYDVNLLDSIIIEINPGQFILCRVSETSKSNDDPTNTIISVNTSTINFTDPTNEKTININGNDIYSISDIMNMW